MRSVNASALRIFVQPISNWRKPTNKLFWANTGNTLLQVSLYYLEQDTQLNQAYN